MCSYDLLIPTENKNLGCTRDIFLWHFEFYSPNCINVTVQEPVTETKWRPSNKSERSSVQIIVTRSILVKDMSCMNGVTQAGPAQL